MTRLVDLDPDMCQDPQPEVQEYAYCVFEQLPNVPTVQKGSSKR